MNRDIPSNQDTCGSLWHRWDPHIHTPGTILNDQFQGADPWDSWLTLVEDSSPLIEALGITDYLSLDSYEVALKHQQSGRLGNIKLIFPNVEMRFGIGTSRNSPINFHLLFSPDDIDHIEQIKAFLRKLTFIDQAESYTCCMEDLIRLGKAHDSTIVDRRAALATGTNQFKVNFDQFREEWQKSIWVRKNAIIAIAVGEGDGTSGLRDPEASNARMRKSIEAFAHIIFSSNPAQISFWLGNGAADKEALETEWNGPKPCLHGSDAHRLENVGVVHDKRFCWIKGDLDFESIRQACIEPDLRVHIGSEPPTGVLPSQSIMEVSVSNATWMNPSKLRVNPGLTAIIGSSGSGKTALADIIAVGGGVGGSRLNQKSFIHRAADHLRGCTAELRWANLETTEYRVDIPSDEEWYNPSIQYLSQQFVDDLCSSEGLSDRLMKEIQRVVFEACPPDSREGASNFDDLLSLRSEGALKKRERFADTLTRITTALENERGIKQSLDGLTKRRDELKKQVIGFVKDRTNLVPKGQQARAERHEAVSFALQRRMEEHADLQKAIRALEALRIDAADLIDRRSPEWIEEIKFDRMDAGLTQDEWDAFKIQFVGNVGEIIDIRISQAQKMAAAILGKVSDDEDLTSDFDLSEALIPDNSVLSDQTIHILRAEASRLNALLGVDKEKSKQHARLGEKIDATNEAIAKLGKEIVHAEGASDRIANLLKERREAYAGVFDAITELEAELKALYTPLEVQLANGGESLRKLSFVVSRKVDISTWAANGEDLLDLRKSGPFRGKGALKDAAMNSLMSAWQHGSGAEASLAMNTFLESNDTALRAHKPDGVDGKEWAQTVAKWLRGSEHIQVSYDIHYDNVEVERLSPGTRGIVLLTLYLAVDQNDDRPLIIDQPEENLDPQSVNDELVSLFREARKRRQIIIVTHNANLVVNTDADQVIVASATPSTKGSLPTMNYVSGGLENPQIRTLVCRILEGGERAFRERARRLRVNLT
jgi:ABC-type nitrate/sulfonate/bicarbonate transport system ATPase subunit